MSETPLKTEHSDTAGAGERTRRGFPFKTRETRQRLSCPSARVGLGPWEPIVYLETGEEGRPSLGGCWGRRWGRRGPGSCFLAGPGRPGQEGGRAAAPRPPRFWL